MSYQNQKNSRRTMGDQVRLLAPQIKSRSTQLPRVSEIGIDGRNHINIWEDGETILGRALSHMAKLPFTHSVYGPFESIEGLWHYIQANKPDESLRTKSGIPALSAGNRVDKKIVPDFRILIGQANWEKINAYPDLANTMMNESLRFEKYYLKEDGEQRPKRMRTVNSPWLISMFEEIRYALRNNIVPDFRFLSDEAQARIQAEYRDQGSNSDLLTMFKSNQPAPVFPVTQKKEAPKVQQPKKKQFKEKPKGTFGTDKAVVPSAVALEDGSLLGYQLHTDLSTTLMNNPQVSEEGILLNNVDTAILPDQTVESTYVFSNKGPETVPVAADSVFSIVVDNGSEQPVAVEQAQ